MVNKEIRDILLGRIVRQEEHLWSAAPPEARFHFHGVKDGAGDIRLFGVSHLSRRYRISGDEPEDVVSEAEAAVESMGRRFCLEYDPELCASLFAPNWIAPVFLTLSQEGECLTVTAYTSRSPFICRFRSRIALWILERRFPEGISRSEERISKLPQKDKTKKRRKR